ncbi:MAG: hypothetical protein AB1705_25415 [Verrucomicrobiota bacterium]
MPAALLGTRHAARCVVVLLVLSCLAGCATRSAYTANDQSITVSGQVFDTRGNAVTNALVEVYDITFRAKNSNQNALASSSTDLAGNYSMKIQRADSRNLRLDIIKGGYVKAIKCYGATNHWHVVSNQFWNPDVERMLHSSGAELEQGLRDILMNYWLAKYRDAAGNVLFSRGDQILPALKKFQNDRDIGKLAAYWVTRIEIEDTPAPKYRIRTGSTSRPDQHPQGLSLDTNPNAAAISDADIRVAIGHAGLCLSPRARNFAYGSIVWNFSGDKALVRASVTNGPLAGQGYDLIFHKRNGKWTLVRVLETWIS